MAHKTLAPLIWLAAVLAGCASAPQNAFSPDTTITIGQYMFPPSRANPWRTVSPPAPFFWGALFDGLTSVDAQGRVQPALALRWHSTDERTWVFELRPGVTFSNGEPFTAATVVRNIEALHKPEARGWIVARDAGKLTPRAIDELTVELRTSEPNPTLPRSLSTLMMVAPDQWERLGPEEFATHPVGTGPFRVVGDWTGTRIAFEAFRESWRPPRVGRLVLLDVRDMAERIAKIASREIDIATIVDPGARTPIEAAGGQLHVRNGTGVIVIDFVTNRESPLRDVRVRRALNYAIDRQSLIDRFLAGSTRPAGSGLRANVPGYDASIAPYPYDPARARALLAEAGFGAGITLKADVSAGSSANQAALRQQIIAYLEAVDVRVEVRERSVPELMAFMFRGGWESDMFFMEYDASTALDAAQPLQLHSCGWMAPWYCNEEATPLIRELAVERDEAARGRLLARIYRAYHDDASALYLYEAVGFDAIGPGVVGFRTPNGVIDYAAISKH
jgi:peptide/nickel transport system substrate-binding protein